VPAGTTQNAESIKHLGLGVFTPTGRIIIPGGTTEAIGCLAAPASTGLWITAAIIPGNSGDRGDSPFIPRVHVESHIRSKQ